VLAEPLVERARGAHRVEDGLALGAADQARVVTGGAEPRVVGAHDRVAGLQPALEQRVIGTLGSKNRDPSTSLPATVSNCPLSGSTLGAAWYNQGLRVIDASDARDLRQVGYYYVNGTDPATNPSSNSWDTAWRGDLVYLFDMDRGIEILRLKGGPKAAAKLATVRERGARPNPLAKVPLAGSGLTPGSLVCPLFVSQ
jgi:hypothetical protein